MKIIDRIAECHYCGCVSLHMDATMTATKTAPTKEEAAAIQRWAEALWVAEKAISQAFRSLDSVRGSVRREINIAEIRCLNLLCAVTKHRGEAERAAEKIA